jgi:hypothetical protein
LQVLAGAERRVEGEQPRRQLLQRVLRVVGVGEERGVRAIRERALRPLGCDDDDAGRELDRGFDRLGQPLADESGERTRRSITASMVCFS